MHTFKSNSSLYVFTAGAIVFLMAPLELIPGLTSQQMAMAGLVIESIGITAGFISYFRDQTTEQHLVK